MVKPSIEMRSTQLKWCDFVSQKTHLTLHRVIQPIGAAYLYISGLRNGSFVSLELCERSFVRVMLFISSTWDVCTHRHDIIPLGAANRFVWPGSLYCVSLYTHALVPSPTPLVPKPDIKKGLPKNNMGNFLPSWELSPCWEDSTLLPPASYLPSLSLCVCSLPAEIWRGDNNSSGGWRGEFSGEVQVYFFLSASLIPSVVCQQRFGGQQQQQWVISKGGGTEVWLPSEPLSAKKEEGRKKGGWGWRAEGRKWCCRQREDMRGGERWKTADRGDCESR